MKSEREQQHLVSSVALQNLSLNFNLEMTTTVSRVVRISDINVHLSHQEVKEEIENIFLKDFRDVEISVIKPKDRKTLLAFLTFQSIREAEDAVNMHKSLEIFGDPVRIAMDFSGYKKPSKNSADVTDLLNQAKTLISEYTVKALPDDSREESHFKRKNSYSTKYVSESKKPPSQTLFLGKLDLGIKKKDIEKALEKYGIIERVMIYNSNPKRVYAFVRFFNVFMARKALNSLKGKKFLHSDCTLGYAATAASNILWIGGIGPWIDIVLLKKKFEEFGDVKRVEWPPNKNFAYVEYVTRNSASKALEKLRGSVLGKRRITADYSDFSQMTSDLNYRDIYLGGDSDSEDEVPVAKPSKRRPIEHIPQYGKFKKSVDLYYDDVYEGVEPFARERSAEAEPIFESKRYSSEAAFFREFRDDDDVPVRSRRNDFEDRYMDDLYNSIDQDLLVESKRAKDFSADLKYTIKNDLYDDQQSPDRYREHIEMRKRKAVDTRMDMVPFKKHRSRSVERANRVYEKYPREKYQMSKSPESPERNYSEVYSSRRSPMAKPLWKEAEETYARSKFDKDNRSPLTSKTSGVFSHSSHLDDVSYSGPTKFSHNESSSGPHIGRDKWFSVGQQMDDSPYSSAARRSSRSPGRPMYKAPVPHAVQMASSYGENAGLRAVSSDNFVKKYPTVWTGGIVLKNKCYWTNMALISGSIPLVNSLLNNSLSKEMKLLKITQRLRLDMPEKLAELERRVDMAGRNGSSVLLASHLGKYDFSSDDYDHQPLSKLSNFLKEMQLAAVILLPAEGAYSSDKGVLHVFPKCPFSVNFLQREAPELIGHFQDSDDLLMIIMKDLSR